jgi:7-carboxy-7-deazaguanine synthase
MLTDNVLSYSKRTLKVNEIFSSIEGEGIRTGQLVTFIRLYGCNLNCSYCDTRYSCENGDYKIMTVLDILAEVERLNISRVTLTGGEPLIHPFVGELINALIDEGYEVNIETNGSIDIYPYTLKEDIIITMDYKSISSGMADKMNHKNLKYLRNQDVLKFVVEDKKDLDDMKRIIETCSPSCSIFVSPVFGKIELPDMVDYIKDNELNECRIQVQLHKIIWEPTKRGV